MTHSFPTRRSSDLDNRAAPGINVDIDARLTLPAQVRGKVPVMINLSWITPPRLPKGFTLPPEPPGPDWKRSEEHTSELQSLMRLSYAVFCLKKKNFHLNLHFSRHRSIWKIV